MINEDKLRKLFQYHVPDDERKLKHEIANEAAFMYTAAIAKLINNPAELTTIVRKILEIRHAVNQAITYDAAGLTIRDIFDTNEKRYSDVGKFRNIVEERIQESIKQQQMPGGLLNKEDNPGDPSR